MTEQTNKQVTEPMGRPPIHDAPMSAAERQRRRRRRLRSEPWNDPRALAWAVVAAVRGLRAEDPVGDSAAISDSALAAIIDRAAEELEPETEQAAAAIAALTRFLDPAEPLPERRRGGHRGRRDARAHKFGDRHRRRRERRDAADDD